MSIQHVAAVLDSRRLDLSGTRKLVLITLANRTDTRGICWPSQDLIAGECGVSLRAVSDHLKALSDAGYVTRTTKHLGQGNGSRTTYRIHLEALSDTPKNGDEQPDIEPEEFAHADFAHAKTVVCTGSRPRVTNLQEPTVSNTNVLDEAISKNENEIEIAFDGFCTMARKRGWAVPQKLTPERKTALRKRLKENTLQGWGEFLRKAAASGFLCGQSEKPFTMTIDWALKPRNILKTMEGNYDNRSANEQRRGGGSTVRAKSNAGRSTGFASFADRLEAIENGHDVGEREDFGTGGGFIVDAEPIVATG